MKPEIDKAYAHSKALTDIVQGINVPAGDSKLFPALFHLTVLEHFHSIIVLVEKKLPTSASTLLRPLFESHVKGLWFSKYATEKDIVKLKKDKFNPIFADLVDELDPEGEWLLRHKKDYWSVLNSLTHTGAAQLGRKYVDGTVTNSHDKEFLKQVLYFPAITPRRLAAKSH